jgi:sterol desaturase/sphingolipid hydroxylase (fatty acid hydroxylase superfamily)
VHHADGLFSASTGVRFHPGELLLSLPLRLAAVVILGAPVLGVIVFEVIFGFANLLVHGDIDLPRGLERIVEKFFVTPALHRRHHGRAAGQLGTNFGTIFSVWDRLLRSFGENRSAAKIEVGIAAVPQSLSLGGVLRLPFSPSRVPVAT